MRRCDPIIRRDTGEAYQDFLIPLGRESEIETPTRERLAKLDRQRPKKGSNEEWEHPRITKMKDGLTRLAHKAEHAVDLATGSGRGGDDCACRPGRSGKHAENTGSGLRADRGDRPSRSTATRPRSWTAMARPTSSGLQGIPQQRLVGRTCTGLGPQLRFGADPRSQELGREGRRPEPVYGKRRRIRSPSGSISLGLPNGRRFR